MHCVRQRAAIALILWLAAMVQAPLALAEERIGLIKVVWGEVSILRDGGSLPAKPGDPVFVADVIETAENSAVGMTFTDNSRISLGAGSVLTIQAYVLSRPGQPDSFVARLERGSLTAASGRIAKSRPLAMRVLTPTTVLGVKGTEFALRVEDER